MPSVPIRHCVSAATWWCLRACATTCHRARPSSSRCCAGLSTRSTGTICTAGSPIPKRIRANRSARLYELAARTGGVFVNPALMEPYGLTLVEAAAHGLPVVATKIGGPQDIIGELEHGLLVDPQDETAIGGAIERLVTDTRIVEALRSQRADQQSRRELGCLCRGFSRDCARYRRSDARPRIEVAGQPAGQRSRQHSDRLRSRGDPDRAVFPAAAGLRFRDCHRAFDRRSATAGARLETAAAAGMDHRGRHRDLCRTRWRTVLDQTFAERISARMASRRNRTRAGRAAGPRAASDYEQRAYKRSYYAECPGLAKRSRNGCGNATSRRGWCSAMTVCSTSCRAGGQGRSHAPCRGDAGYSARPCLRRGRQR